MEAIKVARLMVLKVRLFIANDLLTCSKASLTVMAGKDKMRSKLKEVAQTCRARQPNA